MTSPRGSYSGGYSSPFFPDTPIYDSLVAERGTPQIAPIRVPSTYESAGSNLPALPAALPALPAGPSHHPSPPSAPSYSGHQAPGYQQPPLQQAPLQQAPLQQAPAPYIPQQATAPRPAAYNGGYPTQQAPQQYQSPAGYEQVRPAAAPRPAPPRPVAPTGYEEQPYQRRNLGQGYYSG